MLDGSSNIECPMMKNNIEILLKDDGIYLLRSPILVNYK